MPTLPEWKRSIAALWFAQLAGMGAITGVMAFLPLYVNDLGITSLEEAEVWSGLLMGAGPLTAIQVKVDFDSPHVNGAEFRHLQGTLKPMASQAGVVMVSATVRPFAGPRVIRIGGKDRYETAELISRTDFGSSTTAIVARGDLFPDALAASGLAGIYNAPIVLTKPTVLTPSAAAALSGLAATNVIIVGSEKAVSSGVESTLRMRGMDVERIGGIDRYETASLIARAVVARGGTRGKAFVTRGDLFPDSLAVSPFAYADRRPILLVKPKALPPVTSKALVDLGIRQVLIAGDPNAVSTGVEGEIRSAAGASIERQAGSDRYLTAIQVARWGTASGLGDFHLVGIATGQRFPDALCGGAAVGQLRGVMMMTPIDHLHPAVASELTSHGPELREVQVYGSEAAVSKAGWEGILKAVR
jgi:putative cell wall-binding protein